MDAGNDIHVELRGAGERVLARISSTNAAPATVTVLDDAGWLVAKSARDKTLLLKIKHSSSLSTPTIASPPAWIARTIPPWQVLDGSGAFIGELFAGEPGPTLSPHWSDWIDPKWGLSVATYAHGQHLGIARSQQYTAVSQGGPSNRQSTVVALLPLIAGLSY